MNKKKHIKEYKKVMKLALSVLVMTSPNMEMEHTYAVEPSTDTVILPKEQLFEIGVDKTDAVELGRAELDIFINYIREFYGLEYSVVHALFVDNYDVVIDGDIMDNFINIIEEGLALGVLISSTDKKFNIQGKDYNYINQVKQSNVGALIRKYSALYGVDENLVLAQFRQESGLKHEKFNPNGAYGIAQVEHTLFGSTVQAYNVDTNNYDVIQINENTARNLETNIQIGIAKMQEKLRTYDYNVAMSLQSYNYGSAMFNYALEYAGVTTADVSKNLDYKYYQHGITYVHENPSNYTSEAVFQDATYGDDEYIEKVTRYLSHPFLTFYTADGRQLYTNLNTGVSLVRHKVVFTKNVMEYIEHETKDNQKRMIK